MFELNIIDNAILWEHRNDIQKFVKILIKHKISILRSFFTEQQRQEFGEYFSYMQDKVHENRKIQKIRSKSQVPWFSDKMWNPNDLNELIDIYHRPFRSKTIEQPRALS